MARRWFAPICRADPSAYQTPAQNFVFGPDEAMFFEFEFDPSLLVPGDNVIAVEVHQTPGAFFFDMSFDLELLVGSTEPVGGTGVFYTLDGTDPRLANGDVQSERS